MRWPGRPKPVPGEWTNERAVGDVTDPSVAIQKCLGNAASSCRISLALQSQGGHPPRWHKHCAWETQHEPHPLPVAWVRLRLVNHWARKMERVVGGGGKEKSIKQTTYNKRTDAQLFAQSIRKYCDILLLKMLLKTLYICVQPYISSIIT